VNPLVERYVRHARRFGDPRSAFEAAERDRLLSAADLGYLVARLRDLTPTAEGAFYWQGDGHRQRIKWHRFRLTPREKTNLTRRLLRDEIPSKRIASHLRATVGFVERTRSDLEAELALARIIGVPDVDDPGAVTLARLAGVGQGGGTGPVDLLDSTTTPGLYHALRAILGYRSSSAERGRDRLSMSGIGGGIVTAGLRFKRLTVLRVERDASGRKVAVCRCDCGAETTAKPSHLVRGEKRSCGCLRRERMAGIRQREAA
jgi:hypothetical protein